MTDLITADLVRLDADLGGDKHAVIRALAEVVGATGRSQDTTALADDALAREATSPTGLPGGIAIPHCRTEGVDEPTLAFARLSHRVDFGAKDGAAELVFLIAAPAGGGATHLRLLTKLARSLVKPAFTQDLRDAGTPEGIVKVVMNALGIEPGGQDGVAAPPAVAAVDAGTGGASAPVSPADPADTARPPRPGPPST